MNGHFLTDIDIKQFKCFTDFKASGFKRVNLIGGKNNIGKTAFIEACHINVSSVNVNAMITAIHDVKFRRENLNLIRKKIPLSDVLILNATRSYVADSNLNKTEFFIIEKDATKVYQLNINDELKFIEVTH